MKLQAIWCRVEPRGLGPAGDFGPDLDRPSQPGRPGLDGLLHPPFAGLGDDEPLDAVSRFHLGNGASACAILNGQSVATTMGYSPLDGLTMGTRGGSLDPAVVLDLAERHGVQGAAQILNRESGLLGLGGAADMRALRGLATPEARFAIEHFAYSAIRHAGSLMAAMGGLDGIVFTGGIGEHDAEMRAAILSGLAWAGVTFDAAANQAHELCLHKSGARVAIWRVTADEERQIALEAMQVIASEGI